MVSFGRKRSDRERQAGSTPDEDPVVRQYRFLLREAPSDAVEAAHSDALPRLTAGQRQDVLSAVQVGLVTGQRLTTADTKELAHLVVLGERRSPNAFLATCEPATLRALAEAVIQSDACFGLFGRYARWDGAEPQPEDDSAWADAGFSPDSGRWDLSKGLLKDSSGLLGPAGGLSDGSTRESGAG